MITIRKNKLNLINLNQIQVNDSFWGKYTKLVTSQIIPYQWNVLNDMEKDAEPSHCIENYKIAAGLKEGTFHGFVFQDTDLAKWLEAVAYSLSYEKNEELEKLADSAIDLIGKAQKENGYLDTYFSILTPDKEFCNLKEGHELYTAGHLIEAAVAYYKITGKDKFLNIMCKTADLICKVFHTDDYKNAVPGHEEIELALVKLYEVTGKQRYLEMAKDFVERRGIEPNYLMTEHTKKNFVDVWHDVNPYLPEYGQTHLPVRKQKTAEGHAVRAVYLYSAMADLAYEYQDESLIEACETLYKNITKKRMFITGGIGSSGILERFTVDYDLPNESNYSESCASIGLAFFCRRMAQITGDAKYLEAMEVALMNTVLAGIAMDGKSFFYVNPLEVWPKNCIPHTSMEHVKPVRQKWFGCACCPPNIARTLASLGEYICFVEKDSAWINLFVAGDINIIMQNEPVKLTVKTKFPYENRVEINLHSEKAVNGKLHIRLPKYAKNPIIIIDGKQISFSNRQTVSNSKNISSETTYYVEKGYAVLENIWQNQTITLSFDMKAHFVYANPQVHADAGKAAIVKGPLVYCLEEIDNGKNLSNIFIDTDKPLVEVYEKDTLGGIIAIYGEGKCIDDSEWENDNLYSTKKLSLKPIKLKFVPYCNWGNRKSGEMSVWIKTLT